MKSFCLIVCAALVAFVAACSKETAPSRLQGGISVGNGLTTYKSAYGYQFQYDRALNLDDSGGRRVVVSSAKLESDPKKASTVTIDVLQAADDEQKPVQDSQDLMELAKEMGAKDATVLSDASSERVRFTAEENNQSRRIDLYLSAAGILVRAITVVYAQQVGAQLIEPIANTLELDLQGPVVHSIKLLQTAAEVNSSVMMELEVSDNLSAISLYPLFIFERKNEALDIFASMGEKMTLIEGNRYQVKVQIPNWLVAGDYVLSKISISDHAKNLRLYGHQGEGIYGTEDLEVLERDLEKEIVTVQLVSSEVNLGEVVLNVKNEGAQDREAPKLERFQVMNKKIPQDGFLEIKLKTSDDASGLASVGANIAEEADLYRIEDYPPYSVEDLGNGERMIRFKIGKGFKPGLYRITNMDLTDHAGRNVDVGYYQEAEEYFDDETESIQVRGERKCYESRTYYYQRFMGIRFLSTEEIGYESVETDCAVLNELQFEVLEDENTEADERGPKLVSVQITPTTVPGGKLVMDLELDDDSELFTNGIMLFVQPETDGVLDDGTVFSYTKPEGVMTALGDRKFRYEFELDAEAPKGSYMVEAIMLHDTAGNENSYWATVKGGKSTLNRILQSWIMTSSILYGDRRVDLEVPASSEIVYRDWDPDIEDPDAHETGIPVLRFQVK